MAWIEAIQSTGTPFQNPIGFVTYVKGESQNETPAEWRFGFSSNYELWIRFGPDHSILRNIRRWTWQGDVLIIDIPDELDGNRPRKLFIRAT